MPVPGRPNQSDIRFLNLDIGATARQLDPLVMLIDGDGETFLGFVLADYILIEKGFDFVGLWQGRPRGYRLSLLVIADDLVADVDALIADVDRWPGNEFLDFILRFTAERTSQRVVSSSYHLGKLRLSCNELLRGARSPRLLNHTPWPGWRTNIDRARRPARSCSMSLASVLSENFRGQFANANQFFGMNAHVGSLSLHAA